MKKTFTTKHKQGIVIGLAIVIGIGLIAYALWGTGRPPLSGGVEAKVMDLQQEVSDSGTVQGAQDVSLAFQRSGRVAAVNADVGQSVQQGQVIASLDTSDINAQLLAAQASLQSQQLKLQNLMTAGAGSIQAGSDIQTGIENSRNSLTDKLADAYVKTDTALTTYADPLFTNVSTHPEFGITINQNGTSYYVSASAADTASINAKRAALSRLMAQWSDANAHLDTADGLASAESIAEQTMTSAQDLLTTIAAVLSSYPSSDSAVQAIYASYKSLIATGRTTVNAALTALRSAEQQYAAAQAPASPYAIELQKTAVDAAQAQVDAANAALAQAVIRAPFAGTITEQDAKVGQIASPGSSVIHLISSNTLQVKTNVSEADIGKIAVGMPATVTLDAYGPSASWKASVVTVSPGEKVVNGISTYEVTLQFDNPDQAIKSGMTANVHFIVGTKAGVVAVPSQSIFRNNDAQYVIVDRGSGNLSQQPVTTGIEGANGYTEIVSGLSAGDRIVSFSK